MKNAVADIVIISAVWQQNNAIFLPTLQLWCVQFQLCSFFCVRTTADIETYKYNWRQCDINTNKMIQILSDSHSSPIFRIAGKREKEAIRIVQLHSYLILIAYNQISSEANHHNLCWAGFFYRSPIIWPHTQSASKRANDWAGAGVHGVSHIRMCLCMHNGKVNASWAKQAHSTLFGCIPYRIATIRKIDLYVPS